MSTAPVYLALGAQVAISSATYLIAKGAMSAFAPLELAVLRITGASCVFALLLAIRRCRLQPPAAELPRFFVLGMLGAPLNQGLFLFGLQRTTATHAAVLYALTPLLVFLISWAKGTERPSALRLAGIVMALVGVYVVLAEKGLSGGLENIVGDLLIFAAVTAWAFYSVLGKQLAREHGPLQTTAWGIMLGGAVMVCLAPVAVSPARLAVAGPSAWAAVAFLVLLTSVLSYL
ncbi:MAG: DMT family transporter, partial [Myxococcales bacterium]